MTDKKIAVFIDASNFNITIKRLYGIEYSVDKLIALLKEKFESELGSNNITSMMFYISSFQNEEKTQKQKKFLNIMKRNHNFFDYHIFKLQKAYTEGKEYIEKGLDTQMVADIITTSSTYDIAVLLTEDADFISAIDALKVMKKDSVVLMPEKAKGHHLRQKAKVTILLNDEDIKAIKR